MEKERAYKQRILEVEHATFPPLGNIKIEVVYHNHVKRLPLLMVPKDRPALFGHDWLQHIQLDRKTNCICSGNTAQKVKALLNQFSELLHEELGHFKCIKVTIHVEPDATPCFF